MGDVTEIIKQNQDEVKIDPRFVEEIDNLAYDNFSAPNDDPCKNGKSPDQITAKDELSPGQITAKEELSPEEKYELVSRLYYPVQIQ